MLGDFIFNPLNSAFYVAFSGWLQLVLVIFFVQAMLGEDGGAEDDPFLERGDGPENHVVNTFWVSPEFFIL